MWFPLESLTHWGRVTHTCVGKLTNIDSDDGLSPGRRQDIIWTNAGVLLIGHLGTNFSEISIKIHTFSFKKMHLKMSYGKWLPFCLGLNLTRDSVFPQVHSDCQQRMSRVVVWIAQRTVYNFPGKWLVSFNMKMYLYVFITRYTKSGVYYIVSLIKIKSIAYPSRYKALPLNLKVLRVGNHHH